MEKSKAYRINSRKRIVCDAASVEFHVDNNDYFGTAATLVRLIKHDLEKEMKKAPNKDWTQVQKSFKNLEDDLMILQQNYHIKANRNKVQAEAKGKLKSQ